MWNLLHSTGCPGNAVLPDVAHFPFIGDTFSDNNYINLINYFNRISKCTQFRVPNEMTYKLFVAFEMTAIHIYIVYWLDSNRSCRTCC